MPLVAALLRCVQTDALAFSADPSWCVKPFTGLATVPLILTGAGLLGLLAAFIILCFFCCCSVRPRRRGAAGQQPQFLTGAAAAATAADGQQPPYYPPQQQQQHDLRAQQHLPTVDPHGATYWDEKAERLVPGPGPALAPAPPLSAARSARSGAAAAAAAPPVIPLSAYAPAGPSSGVVSPLGEPVGDHNDYPQVRASV